MERKIMITDFRGEYRFLSNFYPCPDGIVFNDIIFPTVEHAYQASKTLDVDEQLNIALLPTAGQAKRFGKTVKIRPDFDIARRCIMTNLNIQKFKNEELRQKLDETKEHTLTEGNNWHDNYWGICSCGRCMGGTNHLGNLLMTIRDFTAFI